jgi:murein DD-endopeptidase MepM/ murein hydrolase activator NlpD
MRAPTRHALTIVGVLASFCAGVLVDWRLRTYGPPRPVLPVVETVVRAPSAPVPAKQLTIEAAPVATTGKAADAPANVPSAVGRLSGTRLRMPIDGMTVESMKGGFEERRGSSRPHEAADLLSPRNTPVHAVDDGTIAKLFFSKAGGTTIYQFDPSGRLCYYYAHLERYADGLHEGQKVLQGEVIGFVGTSGNAPANTPHLHFAVFELNADHKWWQGRAVDPYLVFKNQG